MPPAQTKPFCGPNEPPPVKNRAIRGKLARLIRECPLFVNVRGGRRRRSLKGRNWGEYICFRGVFMGEKAVRPDPSEPADISDP